MRKDRGRILRRDKRRTGVGNRDKVAKGPEDKTVPHHDGKKRSSAGGGGGRSPVTSMPPEQVLVHVVNDDYLKHVPLIGSVVYQVI